MIELTGIVSRFPHTQELIGARTDLGDGIAIRFLAGVGAPTTRAMLEGLAYDVCGMPIVNYMSAREHGLRVTAVPIFPTRRFLHSMLVCDLDQVSEPRELAGKRIGIGYYGNTDSTWVRGLLAEYGVDLDRITWITSSEEQVPAVTLPANVHPYQEHRALGKYTGVPGAGLDQLLLDGNVAGVIYGRGELVYNAGRQALESKRVGPLFPDAQAADLAWLERHGFFPMMTVIVVRDTVLANTTELAGMLLSAFGAAKERAIARLEAGDTYGPEEANAARISGLDHASGTGALAALLGRDPLPYGIEPNRAALETVIAYAYDQRVLQSRPSVDDLFTLRGRRPPGGAQ